MVQFRSPKYDLKVRSVLPEAFARFGPWLDFLIIQQHAEIYFVRQLSGFRQLKSQGADMAEDSGQRTARVVDEFLTFIRAQPDGRNLMELSNKFERMVNPERTDLTYLSSPDFRNVLRLALVRSRRQPSKVATHVRDVIDHMKLNAPKTPVSSLSTGFMSTLMHAVSFAMHSFLAYHRLDSVE